MGPLRRHLRLIAAAATAGAVVGGGVLAAVLSTDARPSGGAQALRLALAGGESERSAGIASVKGGLTRDYTSGTRVTASASSMAATFGQPTIAGIGGWGFEVDLRLDPSNASRIYMSAPDSASADSSFIWRSLDGGRTFKWVPGAAPLGGKVTTCHGGGDTELGVDSQGRLYFNDLTLANFSVARSDDQGRTFTCSNTGVPDTIVDRQWYAIDGDPAAGGSLYLTNDEVGNGAVQCGNTTQNNTLVMYRSPAAGAGATAGLAFGPPNHITLPGTCDEGIMGNNEVSPVATMTGLNGATLATAVKHVYVIHDDGSLSKIRIARCFPVAFGAPLANVSDPSGLNCVDLPVADLGTDARTGGNFPSLAIDRAGNLYAVWEQAPYDPVAQKAGDSVLMYSYSTDEGNHWSAPVQIPTPGLANNVFAWAAAGDDGRVDIAWYGTPTHVDLVNGGANACPNGGPDSVDGFWSVYFTQTLNGHSSAVTFGTPVVASEHPIRHGSIQTILGNQCGGVPNNQTATNRTLGDFFQLRIGSSGEAQISYADSTSLLNSLLGSHAMHVRQNGGTGVYAKVSPKGDSILLNTATDPAVDATYEAAGLTSPNMPNLDVLSSSVAWPRPSSCHPANTPCLRVSTKLSNLSTAAPASPDVDKDLVWLTQWSVPVATSCTSTAPSCANGGANFMVYAESYDGGAIQCYVGQSSLLPVNGALGLTIVYPGATQLTAPGACAAVPGSNGTITIDVPLSQVSLDAGVTPFSAKLYSVTSSTMTLPQPANTIFSGGGIGGVPFNLIDVVRGYDAASK
ncbi:MAG: hypothetical protein ACJ74V_13695 [Gaiellaceae bacterium]